MIPGSRRSLAGGLGNPLQVFLSGESPWTEKAGGLQSRGLQRIRHDSSDLTYTLSWGCGLMFECHLIGFYHAGKVDQKDTLFGGLLNIFM